MKIAVLNIRFHLHACASLKDKRGRLKGLLERFGNNKNIAACESDNHDSLVQAQLSFVSVGNDTKVIESSLAKIVDFCAHSVDAELVEHRIEWL